MAVWLNEFKKNKNYLLCVDSDGCAMDTMTAKHNKCFGPSFVKVFKITKNTQNVLDRWNEINLYQFSRGVNRFKGLAQILCELYPKDDECKTFKKWTDEARELSEASLKKQIDESGGETFKKALLWSQVTNVAIKSLPDREKKAFDGVREALKEAREKFDIAIVSSANFVAVKEEWERCGLLELCDCITTQQDGGKAHCISELINKGYKPQKIVMVGDAFGDLQAAEQNNVNFYPILVNHEVESWKNINLTLEKIINGDPVDLKKEFLDNLS